MNANIPLLKAQTAAIEMQRTMRQELIEMARYQPLRFHEFTEAMRTLSAVDYQNNDLTPDDFDDDTYDAWHAAHFIIGVLGTIPAQRLKPKQSA